MASTFELQSRTYDGRYIKLTCSQEKDIANNRSKVTWTLSSIGGNVGHYTIAATTVTINGTVVYSIGRTNYTYDGFPVTKGSVSGTTYISHNSDGNKTASVSLSTNIYDWTPISYSGNWTLDNIPRNAYITSAPDFTDNSNPTISYSNPIGSSASSLQICMTFDGSQADVPYRDISKSGTSYTFNLTDAERNTLRNGTSGASRNVGFCIKTVVNGQTLYNTVYKKLTIQETDNTKPTVSISVSANNGTMPSTFNGMFIQGKSKANVSISAQFKYGASSSNYSTSIAGKNYSGSSFSSDYLMLSGDNVPIECTVTDTRGFSNSPSPTPTIKVYPYEKPNLSNIASSTEVMCYRGNSDGTRNNSSNRIFIKAKKVFSEIVKDGSNLNSCTMRLRRKLASSETWDAWTTLSTTNNEYNALIAGVFEVSDAYTIELGVVDTVGESATIIFDIPTDDVVVHLGEGGKAIGIGMYAEEDKDKRVSVGWETHFKDSFFGTHANMLVESDILAYALTCNNGITPFFTNVNSTNLPGATGYDYSVGFVHKRTNYQANVYLSHYTTGAIAVNVYLDGTWRGWKFLTTQ